MRSLVSCRRDDPHGQCWFRLSTCRCGTPPNCNLVSWIEQVADELSAKNAALTAQLNAAPATAPADPAAAVTAGAETEAEPASSRKLEESIPESPRRPLRPCTSAEEKVTKGDDNVSNNLHPKPRLVGEAHSRDGFANKRYVSLFLSHGHVDTGGSTV